MRLYGKKILRRAADRRAKRTIESRDGILWDVDAPNHLCRVRILGSDEFVVATMPQNYRDVPEWLKVGGAVRISHRSGVRGYVEVTGEGRAIPSGILPSTGAQGDMILTGMQVMATSPASNSIYITTGSYRIGGVIYFWDGALYIIMGTNPIVMGDEDPLMGVGFTTFELDPPPATGYYRYDAFVIGTDGVIDYIVGTAAQSDPVQPVVPTDHLLLAYVFRAYGDTIVDQHDINRVWSAPYVSYIGMTDCGAMTYYQTTKSFTVTVYDQYGGRIVPPENQQEITFSKIYGVGEVYSSRDGWDSDSVGCLATNGYCNFQYRRTGIVPPALWTTADEALLIATLVNPGFSIQCIISFE